MGLRGCARTFKVDRMLSHAGGPWIILRERLLEGHQHLEQKWEPTREEDSENKEREGFP